ncbi:MAG TPA: galactokinase [Pantanalinema sp.]
MSETTSSQTERVHASFRAHFGATPDWMVRAPGRVNLIGEHTDYNDGFVFPAAIDREVVLGARHRGDRTVRLYADNFQQADAFDLDAIERVPSSPAAAGWSNYVRGVFQAFRDQGHRLGGMDIAFSGDVPLGAGLSSSAALEVATGTLLDRAFGLGLGGREVALLGQRAENAFVGVQCGIMDQFVSALGERDHALFLDCRSLAYRNVPLGLEARGLSIAIVDSGVKRGLVESQFNARRQECREALERLGVLLARPDLSSLRDVSAGDFASVEADLPETLRARARHVITENERVLASVAALEAGDFAVFGAQMNRSHRSLRDDYAVSTPALDLLVGLAQALPGVLGARLTGAGFGGCIVSLVAASALEAFRREVVERYHAETGRVAALFVSPAADGARVIAQGTQAPGPRGR